MTFTLFFDDGGVLNDNNVRSPQWRAFCGEFLSSQFGGDPKEWGDANQKIMESSMDLNQHPWENPSYLKEKYGDYHTFLAMFKSKWVTGMFTETGRPVPPQKEQIEIFDATTDYVWPRVRSAIPGIVESVKQLHSQGYVLYTSTGLVSEEIKLVLEGMGIKDLFSGFYGPDLINTWKQSTDFFQIIFDEVKIDPSNAIVIEDRPDFIDNALKTGAHVIQACVTGEFPAQYPHHVKDMQKLPNVIDTLIESL
ncbi:MAG: HAD family hydrolase [Candidatus Thorarchaeota archaeon]|jgi:HAD superfamily hydrolase (TIGR01509 family)